MTGHIPEQAFSTVMPLLQEGQRLHQLHLLHEFRHEHILQEGHASKPQQQQACNQVHLRRHGFKSFRATPAAPDFKASKGCVDISFNSLLFCTNFKSAKQFTGHAIYTDLHHPNSIPWHLCIFRSFFQRFKYLQRPHPNPTPNPT